FVLNFREPARVQEVIQIAAWPLILAIVFPTILSMSLFIAGLQKLAAWEVSILSTLEPLTAIVLGALFLSENLSPLQVLGCLIMLFGLALLGFAQRKSKRQK